MMDDLFYTLIEGGSKGAVKKMVSVAHYSMIYS